MGYSSLYTFFFVSLCAAPYAVASKSIIGIFAKFFAEFEFAE